MTQIENEVQNICYKGSSLNPIPGKAGLGSIFGITLRLLVSSLPQSLRSRPRSTVLETKKFPPTSVASSLLRQWLSIGLISVEPGMAYQRELPSPCGAHDMSRM